jgi:hypothetical protein
MGSTLRLQDTLIIGVDPGEMCGMACLSGGTEFWSEGLPFLAALDRLDSLTYGQGARTVISVERFTPSGKGAMTAQVHALEFIGAARFMARKTRVLRFMVTGASDAQRLADRDVLKTLGWWKPGVDHVNQAAAQAAYALAMILPGEFARMCGV